MGVHTFAIFLTAVATASLPCMLSMAPFAARTVHRASVFGRSSISEPSPSPCASMPCVSARGSYTATRVLAAYQFAQEREHGRLLHVQSLLCLLDVNGRNARAIALINAEDLQRQSTRDRQHD